MEKHKFTGTIDWTRHLLVCAVCGQEPDGWFRGEDDPHLLLAAGPEADMSEQESADMRARRAEQREKDDSERRARWLAEDIAERQKRVTVGV